ncbi:MAG: CPBP family glutamic-type intramembrane protease [Anaerolineae bacterium]|nr:CPBP family glutamic-type intramembrane protease [Anaerolineae bacterium]
MNSVSTSNLPPVAAQKNQSIIVVGGMLVLRTLLLVLSYFLTAVLLTVWGVPQPYDQARAWWPVALIFINVIVLGLLYSTTRQENVSPSALIVFNRLKFKEDVFASLWMIFVSMLLAVGATMGLGAVMYGLKTPAELMSLSNLPLWAVLAALVVHPLVNAFIEEMTYNGFVFPRLEKMTHSTPLAVMLVTFFFSLQHIAIPFAFDLKFLIWRFFSFVPLLLFWVLLFMRKRRLTSLIIVHWFMDIFALLTILFIPMP